MMKDLFWPTYLNYPYLFEPDRASIGIDIDGTMTDVTHTISEYARTMFGLEIHPFDITTYQPENSTNLTVDQCAKMFDDPNFYKTTLPTSGAVQAFGLLSAKFNTFFVTSRPYKFITISRDWLLDHGLGNAILVHTLDKAYFAKAIGLRYAVEDSLDDANNIAKVVAKVFLIDRRYNQGPKEFNVHRVRTWSGVLAELLDIPAVCPDCGKFHSEQD